MNIFKYAVICTDAHIEYETYGVLSVFPPKIKLCFSPLGHAVWRGELSTRVPNDGRTQAAGYVNIASKKRMLSFAREKLAEDWDYFSHLTMNVRGDGRKYMINIQVKRDFDLLWNDRWHYPLYTRGGPYWQYVKIPWSKFYLGSRGVLQDKQFAIPLSKTPMIPQ